MNKKAGLHQLIIAAALLGFTASTYSSPITVEADDFAAFNRDPVSNSFGDTDDVNFTWNAIGQMRKWNSGFSGEDAFYCTAKTQPFSAVPCTFRLEPLAGLLVSINSFRLGGYLNANRNIDWLVTDLGQGASTQSGTANVLGTTPFDVTLGLAPSSAGFDVKLGPDAYFGGLVSLTYTISQAPVQNAVPAPGSLALLGLGILGLLIPGVRRRRAATS